jgi:RNA polymerase sporulation-specific sigma factor
VLTFLNERETQIITYRFFKGLTQLQTAKLMNTGQVQISREEKRLLGKLRELLNE